MRGRLALLLIAVLGIVAACSTPEPNRASSEPSESTTPSSNSAPTGGARADATLTGRIVTIDGAPVEGAEVVVLEDRTGGPFDAAANAIFSLGIACVAVPGACGGESKPVDTATTDAEGRYSLTLPNAYLAGYETDEDWTLQVGRAPTAAEVTGPSSSYELEVNTAVQEAPDLVLWDVTPTLTGAPPLLQVEVAPITTGPELAEERPRFVDEGGNVIWTIAGTTLDARVLEDRATRFVGVTYGDPSVTHQDGRTIYHQSVATASVAYQGTAVPLTRAKPCALSDGTLVGCPFTDSDLTTRTDDALDAVTVDLGTPTEVGLVIIRGSADTFEEDAATIEGSADGTSWTTFSSRPLDGAEGVSAAGRSGDGAPSIRYLRVSGMQSMAEISAFAPTDAERAAGARPLGDDDGDDGSGMAKATAAVVAAVLLGAVVLGGRRLRRKGTGT